MILFIILGTLFLVALVFFILGLKEVLNDLDVNEGATVVSGIVGGISFIGLFICSVFAITNNSDFYKERERIKYQEQIASIESTRLILNEQLETSTLTVLEVSAYNDRVREFKTELKQDQLNLKNPWINWLCCPVCLEFDINVVSYLSIE